MKSFLGALAAAPIYFGGCVTAGTDVPPCPLPTIEAADELEVIYRSPLESAALHQWLSDISIYCDAVDVLR